MAAILAAAMSNLSAALNALASTTVMDFWRPWRRSAGKAERSDAEGLAMARWVTVGWGAALFGIGLLARQWGRVLEAGLSIASVLYGALLGVFLLGVLTRRPGELAAISGMVAGLVATLAVRGHVAFTWFVLVGSSVTFAAGWLAGFVFPQSPARLSVPVAPGGQGQPGLRLNRMEYGVTASRAATVRERSELAPAAGVTGQRPVVRR